MFFRALAKTGSYVRGNKDSSSADWKKILLERLMFENIKTKMSLIIFKERWMFDSIVMKAKNSAKMWQLENLKSKMKMLQGKAMKALRSMKRSVSKSEITPKT